VDARDFGAPEPVDLVRGQPGGRLRGELGRVVALAVGKAPGAVVARGTRRETFERGDQRLVGRTHVLDQRRAARGKQAIHFPARQPERTHLGAEIGIERRVRLGPGVEGPPLDHVARVRDRIGKGEPRRRCLPRQRDSSAQ
jgi:hypothetical protein